MNIYIKYLHKRTQQNNTCIQHMTSFFKKIKDCTFLLGKHTKINKLLQYEKCIKKRLK